MRFCHTIVLLLLCSIGALPAKGQVFERSNAITVIENGQELPAPWAGGFSAPQFSEVDLNQDGILDLFVFDRIDGEVFPFVNQGLADSVRYVYAPEYLSAFPRNMSSWALMRDYDGDGYHDIFTAIESPSNIRVYRNTTATNGGNLAFSVVQDTVYSIYTSRRPIFMPRSDIPAIDDVDGDGDLDILTFDTGGSLVEWHKNLSMETLGNLTGLEYERTSLCYGHFKEDELTCDAEVDLAPCAPGNKRPNVAPTFEEMESSRHAGSTLLSIQLNGDSRKDLLVGDVGCNEMYALYDSDTSNVAHFNAIERGFPINDVPIDVLTFPAAYYLDVDNDGIKDLITAPNLRGNMSDERGVWRHKNEGMNNNPDFKFREVGFLQNDMIETGSGSVPTFFDFNRDGLNDLVVGNLGYFDTISSFTPSLKLYQNVGTAQVPVFELVDDNFLGLSSSNFQDSILSYVHPTFGDLDGDGDQDLLFGSRNGGIWHYRNDGNSSNPLNFTYVTDDFFNINADLFTAPDLADLDNDGDQDLIIGNIRGDIHYYENQGSPTAADFVFVTDTFGGIEITDFTGQSFTNGASRPIVLDYDNDGQVEILVGSIEGPIEVFDNVSLVPGATFTQVGSLGNLDFGTYSSVTAAVLDSTSTLTYVMGNFRGGLNLVTSTGVVNAEESQETPQAQVLIYPNPAQDHISIKLEGYRGSSQFEIILMDNMGRVVRESSFRGLSHDLNLPSLADGMYWLRLSDRQQIWTKMIMVGQ